MATYEERTEASPSFLARALAELKFFAGLFGVMLLLFTFVFGHFKIPSESMQPTLEVGDHLYVSKHAYGYSRHSLPFGLHHLPVGDWHIFSRLPERGDVVVFRSPNPDNAKIMIKRVIGLPGDEVGVVLGRLVINGEIMGREEQDRFLYRTREDDGVPGVVTRVKEYTESLPGEGATHRIWEQSDGAALDDFETVVVPDGHVFFMGDNRDSSSDSRDTPEQYVRRYGGDVATQTTMGPGMVPLDHIIGRAEFMMFSFNRCDADEGLRCPGRRWFQKL